MKKLIFALMLISFSTLGSAQNAKQIIGTWLTQDGDSKVVISQKSNGVFEGKITWLKTPNRADGTAKKDDQNPDTKLKQRPILGLYILNDFTFDANEKEWIDGTIYDPKSGTTYKCYMWFEDDKDVLYVKGYIGFSIIGKKVTWKRITN